MSHPPIAIIGMACRFPGGESPEAFWELLRSGTNAVKPIPPERFELQSPHYAGQLSELGGFDSDYFGVTPTETASMDLQQRLMLELGVEALLDAGQPSESLRGKKVGVFIGVSSVDYTHTQLQGLDQVNMYTITGAATSVIANRLSYFFDFHGPSLVVDTACSSALTALHLALQSLRNGEAEMALVGGVNILLSPLLQQGFEEAQALAPDGKCKTFDAAADGMVRGEGAGLVLLKPLAQAQVDQDRIYAVICGSGLSQDGQTNGLSAPSPAGQRRSLQAACADADIDPAQVVYVETHGTGTPLGDPVEARALGEVFGQARLNSALPPLNMGSVKTQIGHLEAAAGIAGLIKACLSMYHRTLPPSLHFQTPNPHIPFAKWHLQVVSQTQPLDLSNDKSKELSSASSPAMIGVSAFGFGGTNVHVLLAAAPQNPAPDQTPIYTTGQSQAQTDSAKLQLLPLSAHSQAALAQRAADLSTWLQTQPALQLNDLQYSLAMRQTQGHYRASLVFDSLADLQTGLKHLSSEPEPGLKTLKKSARKLVFLFSGMGSQEKGMGQQLLSEPVFVARLNEVDAALRPLTGFSVREAVENGYQDSPEIVQPVLFALQLALFALWQAWGLRPDALMGTSMGEISAACAGGWLKLEDAARILVKRIGLLKAVVGSGAMGIIGLSAEAVEAHLAAHQESELWIAGLNGPELTVVSGQEQALERCLNALQAEKIFARRVKGADAPSHSPLMEALKTPLLDAIAGIQPQTGHTPVYSTVNPSDDPQTDFGPDYWWQNLRQAVQLLPAFEKRLANGETVFVEISPHPVLTAGLLGVSDSSHLLPSLRRDIPTARPLFESLGTLYSLGFEVDWQALIAPRPSLLSLPLYPWQRIPCWLPRSEMAQPLNKAHPARSPLATRLKGHLDNAHIQVPGLSRDSHSREGLIRQLQVELATALRLDAALLNPSEPLKHLGIGSLVGMELFSRLKKKFGVKLPLAQFLQGPSLEEIADMILNGLQAQNPVPERLRPDKLPLSFAQTRFWLLEQLQPRERTHFIPVALEITGPLEITALHKACQSVIQRHEILRTVYRQDEKGQPFQVVLADPPPCWEVIDSVHSDVGTLQSTLKRYARLPFDWENTPPLRFSLFVLKSEDASRPQSDTPPDPNFQRYVLLLSLHHIVADGLSFRVLFQELQAVYTAELLAKQPELPTLAWQYADFALWQREQLEKDPSLKADLAYWQTALTGAPVQTLLQRGLYGENSSTNPVIQNTEIQTAEIQTAETQGAQAPFLLPSDTYLALENLAKASGKSLFSLLLTGFYLLLWKFAESDDLVVGTPVAGRLESETQDLIGPFLNMLPLRVQIDPEQNLNSLLEQVQNQVLLALEHQATPFEQMVEVLQPPRIPGLHPLFQTVLALHGEIGFAPLGECQLRPIELDIGVARFDLAFTLIPEQGALKGSVEYNCQLFDAETIQNLVGLWLSILAELPEWSPSLVLKDWKIPGGKEIGAADWFPQPPSETIPERLLPMLAGESETLALIDYQAAVPLRWSYAELWQRARVIAQNLLNLAPLQNASGSPDQIALVAVCLPRGAQTVAAWLGILLADKAYLPLDPESPPERLLALLQSLNNPILICLPETAKVLEKALKELHPLSSLPSFTTLSPEAPLSRPHALPESSQALSNLIFTSGTSGQPKAVKVTQAGMANLIHWHLKTFPSQRGELIPQTAHISFDAAGWEIWSTLAAGATLLFWERNSLLDPLTLQKALLSQQIQQLFLPTPLAALLLQLPWPANTALKCLRTGGDRLPPFQPERLPFQVWNHYGPSECSVVACAGPINALQPGQLPALGQLLPGLKAEILDPQGHLLPWGFPGQLALSGTGLSPGYLHSQPHNQTHSHRYQTGDRLVYLNGEFHFLGRSDRQFKFKGVRIEAAEIEHTLLRHPEVSSAALLPTEDMLWAFYTGRISSSLLKTWLQSQLPLSLVPARLISLERLPETERGKVDYLALQKYTLSAEAQATGSAQAHPTLPLKSGQMGLEKRVGELWEQVLGQPVYSESDFFALGGHSLLAVQMVMQLRQQTGREIGLHQLFAHPRLAGFAKAVAEAKLSPSPLPEVQPQPELAWEPFELTPVQAAYWVGRQAQMALGGVGAQACLELALPDLDLARLELALNRLILRHPMLQTVISAQGQQQPRKDLPAYTIKCHDLRALPPEVQAEQRQALRQASLEAVFDPMHWPLFECSLIRQSAGPEGATDTVLSLRLDALIADATSFILLGQELETLYRHPESELPPLDLNFGDYMRTLAEIRKSPAFERDRDYWQERLADLPEAPLLPLLTAPEQLKTRQFKRLSLQLEAPIWQALKAAGSAHKLTPNSLVLALFAASLSCWSENESFLINLTTFQRLPLHPEVNQLVGDLPA
jgi:acyl transferase domain-containing protein/non-ribosomal peptide synthetase component F